MKIGREEKMMEGGVYQNALAEDRFEAVFGGLVDKFNGNF